MLTSVWLICEASQCIGWTVFRESSNQGAVHSEERVLLKEMSNEKSIEFQVTPKF